MIRFLILWHERTGIDGGTLRSTQILELTRSLSTDVTRLAYTPWSSAGLGHRLRALATGLRHLAAHGSLHPRTLYYFGDTHLTLARFGPVDVLLFEPMAGLAQPVAAAAQPWCRTLVAALHNVEALVYSDPPARTRRTCDLSRRIGELQRELRGCQECDVILTPSRTDEQILALFNMSSIFLPYQAPGERAEALDRIRRERLEPAKDTILVIGSSGNLPTFEGIRQQIEWLAGQAWVSLPPVVCVGAGTERLRPVAPEGVQILGRVDDDALRRNSGCREYMGRARLRGGIRRSYLSVVQ